MMEYKPLQNVFKVEFEHAITQQDSDKIIEGINSLTEDGRDGLWIQNKCVELLSNPSWQVRAAAARGLGNLARTSREVDVNAMISALEGRSSDPEIAGYVEDALEDIEVFMRK